MSSADKKFEEQLAEAGHKLETPPSAVDELLSLLEVVENLVQKVEQSPGQSMIKALDPALRSLVGPVFLRHEDVDVKVAVASCISEITRITAPDAPYNDDQMRDVFHLIVSSFEGLSDKSSRSYNRRALILETVAKVRSCVVMLDLECDGLIVEMFQHFFKAIRDDHPEAIFSSMETIMALVLDESEDISLELLTPLLASVKKDNEEVLPIARKLGEQVLEKCKIKLKPYLMQAVKSVGISLDDYSEVVASICEGTADDTEQNGGSASAELSAVQSKLAVEPSEEAAKADEDKSLTASTVEAAQVAEDSGTGEAFGEAADAAVDKSPKTVASNGVTETGKEEPSKVLEDSIMPEADKIPSESVNANVAMMDGNEDAGKSPELNLEEASKKRGKKLNSSINSMEPSDSSEADVEVEKLSDHQAGQSKDVQGSVCEDQSVEESMPSENKKETDFQRSSPKKLEGDAVNASSSPSKTLPEEGSLEKLEEGSPKKPGQKKKDGVIKEDTLLVDEVSKKASGKSSDSDAKPRKRSGKKAATGEEKIMAAADTTKSEGGTTSDSELKPLKHRGKNVEASINIEGKSSSKKDGGKRRAHTKDSSEKDVSKFSGKDDVKEPVSSPKTGGKSSKVEAFSEETPKTDSKRKRMPFSDLEYNENLVGTKVKVWWPKDKTYYEGVIASFDPVKKKHKISYLDGDEEILNLKREKWEIIEGASESDAEQASEDRSPETSEGHRKKKTKTNSEPSAKQEKMEVSPKRGHAASSGKSATTAVKLGRKSDGKFDGKSRDGTFKSSNKPYDDAVVKSQGHSQKSGKFVDDASKAGSKSKEADGGPPKTPKSRHDTSKTSIKSKGKTPQTGNKTDANGTGKVKSMSKGKDTSDLKEKSPESGKKLGSVKGKSADTLKARESESKSGKKRRRS